MYASVVVRASQAGYVISHQDITGTLQTPAKCIICTIQIVCVCFATIVGFTLRAAEALLCWQVPLPQTHTHQRTSDYH